MQSVLHNSDRIAIVMFESSWELSGVTIHHYMSSGVKQKSRWANRVKHEYYTGTNKPKRASEIGQGNGHSQNPNSKQLKKELGGSRKSNKIGQT